MEHVRNLSTFQDLSPQDDLNFKIINLERLP